MLEDNKPIAKLISLDSLQERYLGSAQGMVAYSDDFNESLKDFDDYL